MKTFSRILLVTVGVVCSLFGLALPISTFAATTPSLGLAATFGILSTTFTNTTAWTTVNGDLGYTIPPAVTPTVNGTTHVADATYTQAGLDQATALGNLNSQGCTFTFAGGPVDLSTDITHGPIGVYASGVYCSVGAMAIGGPLILNGGGTFIFRTSGALTSAAGAIVTLSGGTSACDVFWTPTGATTLAANTTFIGNVIDDAGITVGAHTTRLGLALSFAETISTDTTTVTVPLCTAPNTTLHVIKQVMNNSVGNAVASSFRLHVKFSGNGGSDVLGSPASGTISPGTPYSLNAGTYLISEDPNSLYTQSFTGDCSSTGSITLASGDNKVCTMINTDIPVVVVVLPGIINFAGGGGGSIPPLVVTVPPLVIVTPTSGSVVSPVSGTVIVQTPVSLVPLPPSVATPLLPVATPLAPHLPDTGIAPEQDSSASWSMVILTGILGLALVSLTVVLIKRAR